MRNMTLFRFKVALYLVFTEELRRNVCSIKLMEKKGRGLEFLQFEKCHVIEIASEIPHSRAISHIDVKSRGPQFDSVHLILFAAENSIFYATNDVIVTSALTLANLFLDAVHMLSHSRNSPLASNCAHCFDYIAAQIMTCMNIN